MERRSRLLGLDHADGIAERIVEVEQARVRLMAAALRRAIEVAGLDDEAGQQLVGTFLAELRSRAAAELDDGGDS